MHLGRFYHSFLVLLAICMSLASAHQSAGWRGHKPYLTPYVVEPVTRTGPALQPSKPPVATSGTTAPDVLATIPPLEGPTAPAMIVPLPAFDSMGRSTITGDKSTTAPGAPGSAPSAYANLLNRHNSARALHGAPPLEWDPALAASAADVTEGCVYDRGLPGTNMYYTVYRLNPPEAALDAAFTSWVSEERSYNYDNPRGSEQTAQFTQVVWRSTSHVGCAARYCQTGLPDNVDGTFIVCRYAPPGNIEGEFADNVLAPTTPPGPPGPPSPPSPPAPWPPEADAPPEYVEILQAHNRRRASHGAPSLQWDPALAASAAGWASRCVFGHEFGIPEGENIFASSPANRAGALRQAPESWYNEVQQYDYSRPGFSQATGHFTQMVWKSSQRIGCAAEDCPGLFGNAEGTYVVCRYAPGGNVDGQFEENVQPPIGGVTPPGSTPSADTPPAADAPPEFADILTAHNNYRTIHGSPALSWNTDLAASAAAWASRCVFEHDDRSTGENLYATSVKDAAAGLREATKSWYDEQAQYDYSNPGSSSGTGHFTQVVWRGSTELGCAAQVCNTGLFGGAGGTFVVCRYTPPGNMIGEYGANVLPPNSAPNSPNTPAADGPSTPAAAPSTMAGILEDHNNFRARHGSPPLDWDDTVAASAAAWAARCAFSHDNSIQGVYGENLFTSSNPDTAEGLRQATTSWYNEVSDYNYNNPVFAFNTGHFTQVVWRSTTRLGCAAQACSFGAFVVCRYAPPGNFRGQFSQNVLPPGSAAPAPTPNPTPNPAPGPGPIQEEVFLAQNTAYTSPGCLNSENGATSLCMQGDGNLVQYDSNNRPVWTSNNPNRSNTLPYYAWMHPDGRLIIADRALVVLWATPRPIAKSGPYRLVVGNNGNVAVYDGANMPVWSTLTTSRLT